MVLVFDMMHCIQMFYYDTALQIYWGYFLSQIYMLKINGDETFRKCQTLLFVIIQKQGFLLLCRFV